MVLNDASMRNTASYVSVQGKQRFIGDNAAALARTNIKNTISLMKLLVGRNYDEEDVQRELSRSYFQHKKLPSGGVGIIVNYNDEPTVMSAEHLMAILLVKAKQIVEAANGVGIAETVLGVPSWFTDAQRRGILHAAEIAELNCLKVVNESTAIALSYGIYKSAKKMFSETEPTYVMFIDLGYTCYSVSIAAFVQEKLHMLSNVCDRNIGGRCFDDVIVEFLAEEFQRKHKINVRDKPKAMLKLQAAAEKAKKTLSPAGVNEVNISVECLAEDHDLNCLLTRDEFEKRCASLLSGLQGPIEECLREAGITKEQLSDVEIVGGGSRVNSVKRTLGQILGLDASAVNYGLKTTMNSDEAVARGSALQCAILSSRIKVKPFNIIDRLQYPVSIEYDAEEGMGKGESKGAEEDEEGDAVMAAAGVNAVAIYTRGDDVPRKPRRLTFRNKVGNFSLRALYGEAACMPRDANRAIATYNVIVPEEYRSEPHDVRVTFNVDKNNCLYLASAQLMVEVEVPPAAPAEESKGEAKGAEEPPAAPKRKFKKIDLRVEVNTSGLTREEIKQTMELEASMANEDRIIIETSDRRNALEAYIYSMRDKLDGVLKPFATNSEKIQFREALDKAEDWLYNEGFESTKSNYIKRLDDLKASGNPIETRYHEETGRPQAADGLKRHIEVCKLFASNTDDIYSHITDDERKQVLAEAEKAEEWLYDQLDKQSQLSSYDNPVLTVAAINAKKTALFNATNPTMTKPKPKPPTPKPEEKKAEEPKADSKAPNPAPADDSKQQEKPAEEKKDESEPMETA